MIRLLRWLFTGDGHAHKWKTLEVFTLTAHGQTQPYGRGYHQKCEVCGKMRQIKLGI